MITDGGGCSWQSWWKTADLVESVEDPNSGTCESAPARVQTLKGTKPPNKRFFSLFFWLPSALTGSSWPVSRLLWESLQHLLLRSDNAEGGLVTMWNTMSGMSTHNESYVRARRAGQRHWGEPTWKESRVKMAGKLQQHVKGLLQFTFSPNVCESAREDINGRWWVVQARWQAAADPLQFWLLPNGQEEWRIRRMPSWNRIRSWSEKGSRSRNNQPLMIIPGAGGRGWRQTDDWQRTSLPFATT